MATVSDTVNGIPVQDFREAEKSREIEEHRQSEVRSVAKQAAKRCGASKQKLRTRLPGHPAPGFSVSRWEKMQRLFCQGKTQKEVAPACGVSTVAVLHYCRHFVSKLRTALAAKIGQRQPLMGKILVQLAEASSNKEVGAACGVPTRLVRRYRRQLVNLAWPQVARRQSAMRRRSGDERRLLAESIQRLVDEDKSVKKVAVELGIRRSTVRRYRKNYAGQLLPQSPSTGTPSAPTNATPASGGISPAV